MHTEYLCETYGDNVITIRTCANWFKRFKKRWFRYQWQRTLRTFCSCGLKWIKIFNSFQSIFVCWVMNTSRLALIECFPNGKTKGVNSFMQSLLQRSFYLCLRPMNNENRMTSSAAVIA